MRDQNKTRRQSFREQVGLPEPPAPLANGSFESVPADLLLARAASFPELNPHPIVEVDVTGTVHYANPAARRLLPDLQQHASEHPWLAGLDALLADLQHAGQRIAERDVAVGAAWYQQFILHLPEQRRVRIYGAEITDRKRTEERIFRQNALLAAMNWMFQETLECESEEELGRACLTVAEELTQSPYGFLGELDPQTEQLKSIAVSNPGWDACRAQGQAGHIRTPILGLRSNGLYGRTLAEERGLFINALDAQPQHVALPDGHPPLTAFLGVPLRQHGRIIGVLAVANRAGGYRETDREALEALAGPLVQVWMRWRAEQSLRASEERLSLVLHAADIGTWDWNIATGTLLWSPRCLALFGLPPGTPMTYERFIAAIHPDDRQHVEQALSTALEKHEEYYVEKRAVWPDGSQHWIAGRGRAYCDAAGKAVRMSGAAFDITDRKRAEMALRHSEERYRAVVEHQTELISRFQADGTFTFVNEVYCRFFGKTSRELLGQKWQPVPVPEDVPMIERQLRALAPINPIVVIENRVRSAADEIHWMQFINRGFFDPQGQLTEIQSVGRDITERKLAQAALERERRTLQHLLQSSDHERQLIAYEIHDGLAQYLAGAIMQFQVYAHLKESEPQDALRAFEAGKTMLHQSHFETRRLISGVRPPILDEEGVVAALVHLINELRRHPGPQIEFHSQIEFERLSPILENAVYRIAGEALHNAYQHSKGPHVRLDLRQYDDRLRIEVRDRGVGFSPDQVREGHFGLEGMRERARLLNGDFRVESQPGHGARVIVHLPIVLCNTDGTGPDEEP